LKLDTLLEFFLKVRKKLLEVESFTLELFYLGVLIVWAEGNLSHLSLQRLNVLFKNVKLLSILLVLEPLTY
jgi:hypothetical protein